MSVLERYARNKNGEPNSRVVNIRMPESLWKRFCQYCDDLGISASEGIRILIEEELKNSNTGVNNDVNNSTRVKRGRFSVKAWTIDRETACPQCKQWISYSNFARHVREHHHVSTNELFSDPQMREIADQMVAERKAAQGQSQEQQEESGA